MKTKENVIVECTCHWLRLVLPCAIGAFFALYTLAALIGAMFTTALILLLITAACAIWACVRYFGASLVLTETAVIGRIGIIKTRKLTSPISKVQDISISNGLLGKLFRYHTVTVSTAGSGVSEYVFPMVTNAEKLQQEFLARTK